MKNYLILSGHTHVTLEANVIAYLGKGWRLEGGVAVVYHFSQIFFYQAVSKGS